MIWFGAGAVGIVWAVFQTPTIDYRLVALGAVLGVGETPFGPGPLHTLLIPTLVLGGVMLATMGRRLRRRQLLGLPIGMYLHLVLDGAWARPRIFWWPARGWRLGIGRSSIVERGIWSVVLELLGVGLAAWLWSRFGLADRSRRRRFWESGQLDRTFVRGQSST